MTNLDAETQPKSPRQVVEEQTEKELLISLEEELQKLNLSVEQLLEMEKMVSLKKAKVLGDATYMSQKASAGSHVANQYLGGSVGMTAGHVYLESWLGSMAGGIVGAGAMSLLKQFIRLLRLRKAVTAFGAVTILEQAISNVRQRKKAEIEK